MGKTLEDRVTELEAEVARLRALMPADDEAPPTYQEPEPVPCPEGFHWIGQSFASCDKCGLPAWEHAGVAATKGVLLRTPFDEEDWVLEPWKPGEREGIRRRWENH